MNTFYLFLRLDSFYNSETIWTYKLIIIITVHRWELSGCKDCASV